MSTHIPPLLSCFKREVLRAGNYDESFNHVLPLVMHSIRRAPAPCDSPSDFAARRETARGTCARNTCNAHPRARRAVRGDFGEYHRDKGSTRRSVDITESRESDRVIGLDWRNVVEKNPRDVGISIRIFAKEVRNVSRRHVRHVCI